MFAVGAAPIRPGERVRPRALSGAPPRPTLCDSTGLRPHFFPIQPAGARAGTPEEGVVPETARCRAIAVAASL
jgi:hypothetical protein